MAAWFAERIIDTGRLPLFCFFAGMVVGFVFIRTSTRLIRAQVRWWPGNVEPGGLHIHHVVFGVAFMIFFGVVSLAVPDDLAGGGRWPPPGSASAPPWFSTSLR